jgi:hypothetical protein
MRAFGVKTALLLAAIGAGASPAWSDDTAQQQNMTQREFNKTVATKTAEGESPETLLPVHDIGSSKDVRAAGGRKVIEGNVWKDESPEEREAHLKRLPRPEGTVFMIEVPSGNVWVIPAGEKNENINKLIRDGSLDVWDPYEVIGMPVAVGNGPTSGDRPGRGYPIPALAIALKF